MTRINTVLTGWVSYFRVCNASRAFREVGESVGKEVRPLATAASLAHYCARFIQAIAGVPMSAQRVVKCIHHALRDILLRTLADKPGQLEK